MSAPDQILLTAEQQAQLQKAKQAYYTATAEGDTAGKQAAHELAESIRAQAGYSGGSNGNEFVPLGGGVSRGTSGVDYVMPSVPHADVDGMRDQLSQWRDAADRQNKIQVDYAVQQAVQELQRAQQDAQDQFKEQAETVSKEERQGLDNSALYAEARGDKGGIGHSQYNEIQAAAAQNRLAVQQAQTKLSTDTARQIADLRAKGEFEKADAALEVAQTYLAQLVQLEQWAAEYGLSAAQFEANLAQWKAEFDLAMQQYQTGVDQWNQEFDYQKQQDAAANQQWQASFEQSVNQNRQSQLASMGEALLNAGILPNTEQLSAMGLTEAQAQQWLIAAQLTAAQNARGGTETGGGDEEKFVMPSSTAQLYQMLYDAGVRTAEGAMAQLTLWGVASPGNYTNDYVAWYRDNKREQENGAASGGAGTSSDAGTTQLSTPDGAKIYVPGYGMVSWEVAQALVENGVIQVLSSDPHGDPIFSLTPKYAAQSGAILPDLPALGGK